MGTTLRKAANTSVIFIMFTGCLRIMSVISNSTDMLVIFTKFKTPTLEQFIIFIGMPERFIKFLVA